MAMGILGGQGGLADAALAVNGSLGDRGWPLALHQQPVQTGQSAVPSSEVEIARRHVLKYLGPACAPLEPLPLMPRCGAARWTLAWSIPAAFACAPEPD